MTLLAIAAVALFARLAVVLVLLPSGGLLRQEPSVIAANVNAGLGFVYPQYGAMYYGLKEPGHVVILALLTRWLGDRDVPILLLQAACGMALAILVAVFTERLTGDRLAGTLAGCVTAVNPFLVYYDSLIVHSLSLDMVLFALATAANVQAVRTTERPFRAAALAGLVTGIALWQRSLLLFGGLGLWTVAIILARGRRGRLLGHAVVWLTVTALVVAPWFVRNRLVIGRWLFTTDFAHVLWLGNNPLSNGTYSDARGERIYYQADPRLRARIEGHTEIEQMETFLADVRRFVREEPGVAASLVARKAWAFVWFAPNVGAEYRPWQVRLYVAWYVTLLVIGVGGVIHVWKSGGRTARNDVWLVAGTLLGIMTLHAIVAINMKHRVPLEIVLGAFAGCNAARALRGLRRRPT
jgi:hypothetical protein